MDIINGYKLSTAQSRAWGLKSQHALNTCLTVKIEGEYKENEIQNELLSIVKNHNILRTSYHLHEGLPLQVINDEIKLDYKFEDLTELENNEQQNRVLKVHAELRNKALNLSEINFRAYFYSIASGLHYLTLAVPSVNCDSKSAVNIIDLLLSKIKREDQSDVIQYIQYSQWQSESQQQEQESLNFWNEQARSHTRELSFQQKVNEDDTSFIEVKEVVISKSIKSDIQSFLSKHEISLRALIYACWTNLLWLHLERPNQLVTGCVVDGRVYDEFNGMLGLFAQTVPSGLDFDTSNSFLDFCIKIEDHLENLEYHFEGLGDFPKGRVESNVLKKSLQYTYEYFDLNLKDFEVVNLSSTYDSFKLKLSCIETNSSFLVNLFYQNKAFSSQFVDMLSEQLVGLLTNRLDDSSGWNISLTQADHKTIASYNSTKKEYPFEAIVTRFSKHAIASPHQQAVSYKGKSHTYDDIYIQARKLAGLLSDKYKIVKGNVVAIHLDNSKDVIVTTLAAHILNAAYLVIDKKTPEARAGYMLADSLASVIVCDEKPQYNLQSLIWDDKRIEGHNRADGNVVISEKDKAYIIYTSGSTGKPKGIVVSHGSLHNYCCWFNSTFDISENDHAALFSSLAYDLGYTSLWTSLFAGAQLTVFDNYELLNVEALIDKLIESKITYVKMTPSHLNLMVNSPVFESKGDQLSLRLMALGGENININDVEAFWDLSKKTIIVNHYGPTETTIGTSFSIINEARLEWLSEHSIIGSPISNNEVYIINESNQPCAVGLVGEICIGGKGLANYLSHDLNTERFINNPLKPEQKLYCTGDMGRLMPEGEIQFLGRRDGQVKIRGYRVELREIENVISTIEGINKVVVMVDQKLDNQQLLAFYQSGSGIYKKEIISKLKQQLPEYMIPLDIQQVESFPYIGNGKIDLKALLKMNTNQMDNMSQIQEPRTPLEKHVAEIWKKVLSKEQVGINDPFFDIGGNSLRMVKVFRELNKSYSGLVTMADLFKYNTIETICSFIEEPDSDNDTNSSKTFEV
ncbi:MAG: amino acid adenylation domain-containing protein [Cyclobacteriaceae bacterium]|jgi:amino acid adenylation domain-containing protein